MLLFSKNKIIAKKGVFALIFIIKKSNVTVMLFCYHFLYTGFHIKEILKFYIFIFHFQFKSSLIFRPNSRIFFSCIKKESELYFDQLNQELSNNKRLMCDIIYYTCLFYF